MSLRDKAAKLNFASLPGVGPGATDQSGARPKTAPGAMMAFANDQRSELLRENDSLRQQAAQAGELQAKLDDSLADLAQWNGAKPTRLLDPNDIRPSRFANRHGSNFQSAEFGRLKAELQDAGGNVQPVKVRQVTEEGGQPKFELVYGHRRWEGCRQLGLPVLAVVDNIDDQALFAEMDRENRARKDLSPWEQGVTYRRALDEGLFPSNRKLAGALGVSVPLVGQYLVLADLPKEVVEAFVSPLDLRFRSAKLLSDALKKDRSGVIRRAKSISARSPRPPSKAVLAELIGAEEGVKLLNPPAVFDIDGKRVVLTERKEGGGSLVFEAGTLSPERKRALIELLTSFAAGPPQTGTGNETEVSNI